VLRVSSMRGVLHSEWLTCAYFACSLLVVSLIEGFRACNGSGFQVRVSAGLWQYDQILKCFGGADNGARHQWVCGEDQQGRTTAGVWPRPSRRNGDARSVAVPSEYSGSTKCSVVYVSFVGVKSDHPKALSIHSASMHWAWDSAFEDVTEVRSGGVKGLICVCCN
jgi:hypothetical protein